MASKKVDLLVRVRYSNPLPPPPCPPKLLLLETDLGRLASYQESASIARGQPLPMMVDGECGMGVDLLDWRSAWEEGNYSEMNPTGPPPTLAAADAELLMPPRPDLPPPSVASSSKRTDGASGTATPSLAAPANTREPANNWLLNAKGTAGELRASQRSDLGIDHSRDGPGAKGKKAKLLPTQRKRPEKIDSSAEAQQRLIERTFDDLAASSIDSLRFPGKPELTVAEVHDILPDPSTWATGYSLFRFQEPPGAETAPDAESETPDARLTSSLWRPLVNSEGDNIMAYYLAGPDDAARAAESQHVTTPDEDYVPEPITYSIKRKYELVGQGRQGTELSLVFRDESEVVGASGKKRKLGIAGYHEFISRTTLRKKRAARHGEDEDEGGQQWDDINFTLAPAEGAALEERSAARAAVDDPTWEGRTLAEMRAQAAADNDFMDGLPAAAAAGASGSQQPAAQEVVDVDGDQPMADGEVQAEVEPEAKIEA